LVELPQYIHIREVTPRDGLQAEPRIVATADKVALVDRLTQAGFVQINVTSFVSPRAVPQMSDCTEVLRQIARRPGVVYDASVPNARGAVRALELGVEAVSVFVSASDEASRRNVRRSREEALVGAEEAIRLARDGGARPIGTIANAFGSPYGDEITLDLVLGLAERLAQAGIQTLTLGDTSGEASPPQVQAWVEAVQHQFDELVLALHLHDSRGTAVANAFAGMQAGVTHFDAALGGLGGSPFTKDAAGNLCTEDLVAACHRSGVDPGVCWQDCVELARFAEVLVGHELPGRSHRLVGGEDLHELASGDVQS
jgi:hydroxymethylglutaryl-CoA lyase